MINFMKLISLCLVMTSCTYTVNLVHTLGDAKDVVDDNVAPTNTTSATVPVHGL